MIDPVLQVIKVIFGGTTQLFLFKFPTIARYTVVQVQTWSQAILSVHDRVHISTVAWRQVYFASSYV